jgi:peptide/nickel transport system permease protein
MILTLLVLSLVIFYTTIFYSPEQRAMMFASPSAYSHPGQDFWSSIPDIIKKYHLDDPFYVQYARWLQGLLTGGSLGYSFLFDEWISVLILKRLPATLELIIYSTPIIVFGGIKLGAYSARRAYERKRREDPIDFLVRAVSAWAYSIPTFFVALVLISIVSLSLHWLPLGRVGTFSYQFITSRQWVSYTGLYTIDALLNGQFWIFLDALTRLALPVLTLTVSMLPVVVKVTRSSMLGELGKEYVVTAKAKGLRKVKVISHAKRNAMISVLTISSILVSSMLTGIVITEFIFDLKGIGWLVTIAAGGGHEMVRGVYFDFALLAGLAVFFCVIFVIVNLIVDIIYTYVDPRVKL